MLIFVVFFVTQCKRAENPCTGMLQPRAEFGIKEVLSDTAFYTDTAFADNTINFCALLPYKSVQWKIGDDPREFAGTSFNLNFPDELGTFDIAFTGKTDANPACFPGDNGSYSGTKQITIVEQLDKATLTRSPLTGSYSGAFDDNPHDIFTVRIDYFDSAKYNTSITGTKNFYWISNMPKGYIDSTSSRALAYPELRNGMLPEMGYKCLQFGDITSQVKGRGFAQLVNNTLKVYYNNILTGRRIFTGKRI